MENRKITIENGAVHIPKETKMSITGIADLFEVFYQTAKQETRAIERSGIASGDYSLSCTLEGEKIYPDYYALEMVIALSFRIKSKNAEVLRKWLLRKAAKTEIPKMLILPIQNSMLN